MEKLEHLAGKIFKTNKRVFIPFIDFKESADQFGNIQYYIQRRIDNDKGVERLEERVYIEEDDDIDKLKYKLEKYIERYGI